MFTRSGTRLASQRSLVSFVVILGAAMECVSINPSAAGMATEAVDQTREDRLRAGYLLNFAKFVEWPSFPDTEPLLVCFLGGSGVRVAFEASSAGRSVANHPLLTRQVRSRVEAAGCSMVYIDASVAGSNDYSGKSVPPASLTVGDAPDFLARGGIIEMFTKDNHLRFNISLFNAQRASLRIGSDLLQLAVRVEDGAR